MQHRKIVVVDDNTDFLAFIETLLAFVGYTVFSAQRSADASALINKHHPDIVMLDIRMEHANSGLDVLAALRASTATAHIPVILCSADVEALYAYEAQQEPGTTVLAKPFELYDLLAVLQPSQKEHVTRHS